MRCCYEFWREATSDGDNGHEKSWVQSFFSHEDGGCGYAFSCVVASGQEVTK